MQPGRPGQRKSYLPLARTCLNWIAGKTHSRPARVRSEHESPRSAGRHQRFDIAGTSREGVISAGSKISVEEDLATTGIHLNQGATHRLQVNCTADGSDLDVRRAGVRDADRSTHSLDVHVAIAYVANFNRGLGAFQRQIALQTLSGQGAGGRMHVDVGVGRHRQLVIHASALPVGAWQQTRFDFNPAAVLRMIHLHLSD